jgi:hypothetical protein
MLVDCQTCPVRGVHCADCMVTALSALPIVTAPRPARGPVPTPARAHRPVGVPDTSDDAVRTAPLDRSERRAVSALLGAGLVTTATANAARAVLDPLPSAADRARHAG